MAFRTALTEMFGIDHPVVLAPMGGVAHPAQRIHRQVAGPRGRAEARAEFRHGAERADLDYLPIWAGEAVDLITELDTATALVGRISAEATHAIDTVWREHHQDEPRWEEP